MQTKELNSLWKQSIVKEKLRHTNSGKGHKGDKFSVPVDISNFAPSYRKKSR
jgi:hypothetical protein